MTLSRKTLLSIAFVSIILVGLVLVIFLIFKKETPKPVFSGDSAYQIVLDQMSFGPRTPGSQAHQLTQQYIIDKLKSFGWEVETQNVVFDAHPVNNIIARRGTSGEITLLGAHYDSRLYATEEVDEIAQSSPVPGANDGASGVAVLLELARTLPPLDDQQIWLVFFDLEDQGRINGWEWIIGSRAFVQNLSEKPDRVVILDMIGDADLQIYREWGSDPTITDAIWDTASRLGYGETFVNEVKYSILDDHVPFIDAGIPAVDIIDFDYPYWHTLEDTADKVSPRSLEIIGLTITAWLMGLP
jgi:Zn-dependent M28 family amino/carboxypeptidase